jgi:hypothetical protein
MKMYLVQFRFTATEAWSPGVRVRAKSPANAILQLVHHWTDVEGELHVAATLDE